MKFLFVLILLLLGCGWLYKTNHEKLIEYTAVKNISRVKTPKIKLIKQNTLNNPVAPELIPSASARYEIKNVQPPTINDDQEITISPSVYDDQDSNNANSDDVTINRKSVRNSFTKYVQNNDLDVADMDVGPTEMYASNKENLFDPEQARAPAEEQNK